MHPLQIVLQTNCECSGIEDLREKREEVQKQIRDEEAEKAKLQQDLQTLTKRLAHINDGLARKVSNMHMCFACTSAAVQKKKLHSLAVIGECSPQGCKEYDLPKDVSFNCSAAFSACCNECMLRSLSESICSLMALLVRHDAVPCCATQSLTP